MSTIRLLVEIETERAPPSPEVVTQSVNMQFVKVPLAALPLPPELPDVSLVIVLNCAPLAVMSPFVQETRGLRVRVREESTVPVPRVRLPDVETEKREEELHSRPENEVDEMVDEPLPEQLKRGAVRVAVESENVTEESESEPPLTVQIE